MKHLTTVRVVVVTCPPVVEVLIRRPDTKYQVDIKRLKTSKYFSVFFLARF